MLNAQQAHLAMEEELRPQGGISEQQSTIACRSQHTASKTHQLLKSAQGLYNDF